jgi:hypothetical protein
MGVEVLAFLQREIGEPLCGRQAKESPVEPILQCRVYVRKQLNMKHFHVVLTRSIHECSLK